jgi:S-adenosylmethionine:tRNA ribosyltransferase-isomerase
MRLSDFDYELPVECIAQVPIEPRDAARLLVDRGSAAPEHLHVRDLPSLLTEGDLLVVNDTKVIPARLRLHRTTGGAAEVLLLEPMDTEQRTWEAMIRPARKLPRGERLEGVGGEPLIEIGDRIDGGDTWAGSLLGDTDPLTLLQKHGEMPLPPYIGVELAEPDRYQTVYAAEPASAAAPTAGLHFTPELSRRHRRRGVEIATVELVVGLDTFKPVVVDDDLGSARDAQRALSRRSRRVGTVPQACGCRRRHDHRAPSNQPLRSASCAAATKLFINRPYDWKVVDVMMTNFHLPRTTLLMMIDAFVGDRWRRLYETAIAEGYRMLSFGDAMLLDRRAA